MQTLTQRQDEVFEYIRSYLRDHQRPPTIQEIGDALGMKSTNGVHKVLVALERKGYVVREENAARGIRVLEGVDAYVPDGRTPLLPVLSRTDSAHPERLRQQPAAHFAVDPYFLPHASGEDTCCIVRAGDDGMKGEAIRKGDYVIVEETGWQALGDGELVAVVVGEALKVRWFEHVNGRHHLRTSNRHFLDEVFVPGTADHHILGRVVGLIRPTKGG